MSVAVAACSLGSDSRIHHVFGLDCWCSHVWGVGFLTLCRHALVPQTKVIVKLFQQHKELSVQDITAYSYIRTDDVISTLQTLQFIRYHEGQQYGRLRSADVSEQPRFAMLPVPVSTVLTRSCRIAPRSIIDLSNAPPQLLNPKPFTVQRMRLPFDRA